VSRASPVIAAGPAVYDTVDAVEVFGSRITVTGIIAGQSAPSEFIYVIFDGSSSGSTPGGANRCDRLALLAMAKPGKYQFATLIVPDTFGSFYSCKLIVRTP
jgi:hypothetical protein